MFSSPSPNLPAWLAFIPFFAKAFGFIGDPCAQCSPYAQAVLMKTARPAYHSTMTLTCCPALLVNSR